MALFRVKFAFAGKKQGWSEIWVFPTANDLITGQTLNSTVILPIAQARSQMLGREYVLDAYAISKIRLNDGTPQRGNVKLWSPDLAPSMQSASNAGAQPRECLIVQVESADGQRKKNVFMRGIPDDIAIDGGEVNLAGAGGWGSRFNSWSNLMIQAGAGWLQNIPVGEPANVTGYVVNANNTITIAFDAPLFNLLVAGTRRIIRVSGINGKSVLSGEIEVAVVDEDHATTKQSFAVFPYQYGGRARIYQQPKPFISGVFFNPALIRTRDTGRPSYATRGRQPARARG